MLGKLVTVLIPDIIFGTEFCCSDMEVMYDGIDGGEFIEGECLGDECIGGECMGGGGECISDI